MPGLYTQPLFTRVSHLVLYIGVCVCAREQGTKVTISFSKYEMMLKGCFVVLSGEGYS